MSLTNICIRKVYWASYADYVACELSVDYLLTNNTVGLMAEDVVYCTPPTPTASA